ncbi:MAG TPA: hypothetical protein VIW73_13170 [Candidatus Cybelea sp.]
MPNRHIVLRSIFAVTLLFITACQSNGAVSPPAGSASATGKVECQPDFSLTLNPTSATITTGQSIKIAVSFTSICGLAGGINFGISNTSPQPQGDGFTLYQPRYDIRFVNSKAVGYITLEATRYTRKTTWTVTITGKPIGAGCCYGLTHSATFLLTVQ